MAANPIPPQELNLETKKSPEETIVTCSGRITSNTTAKLQEEVRNLIPGTKTVVLDLTNVNYMDSSGLGAVISLYLTARRQRCGFKLVHLSQRLMDLFRITKLTSVLEGHDDFLGWTPD